MPSFRNSKAEWPIPREELIERRNQFDRVQLRLLRSLLVPITGLAIAGSIGIPLLVRSGQFPESFKSIWQIVLFSLVLLVNFLVCWHFPRKWLGSFDLLCPSCSKELKDEFMSTAVTTGRCGNCATLLVSDHSAVQSDSDAWSDPFKPMDTLKHTQAHWPVPLRELIERRDQRAQFENLRVWFLLALFCGTLISLMPVADWLDEKVESLPLWAHAATFLAFSCIWILPFLAIIRSTRNRYRSFGLVCPSCSKLLMNNLITLTVATGHCGNCGTQLVSDHPSKFQGP